MIAWLNVKVSSVVRDRSSRTTWSAGTPRSIR